MDPRISTSCLCHNSNEKDADRLSDKRTTFSSTFQKSERWAFPAGDPTSTCLLPPHTISILNLWFHTRVIVRWAHRKNVLIALRLLPKSPVPTLFRPGFHLSSDRGWRASRRPGPNQSLSPPPPPPTMFSSPATVESKYGKSMKESCERVTASSSPIDPTSEGVNMRQTNKSLSNRKPKDRLVNLIKDLCRTRRANDGLK